MRLKKVNAVLALLSTFMMILHIGFNIISYLTMYYNPQMKLLTALPFMVLVCLHAVTGMCSVFLSGDGTRLDLYPMQNIKTVIQRITAAVIFPLLFIHLKTFVFLKSLSEGNNWAVFAFVILIQILFFAVVISHAAVSFPKALVTLGILAGRQTLTKIEKIVYVAGFLLFIAAVCAVIRGELIMFLPGQE